LANVVVRHIGKIVREEDARTAPVPIGIKSQAVDTTCIPVTAGHVRMIVPAQRFEGLVATWAHDAAIDGIVPIGTVTLVVG
jgi:hypothetical protein